MHEQPLVLIVILNWNGAAATLAAVDSLTHLDYQNWRALVIDNGSTDGSLEQLQSIASDRIELIAAGSNTGYTGGCNTGLRHALEIGADYAWLLNSDATTDPHALSSIVRLAESDERIGLVSPLIASDTGSRQVFFAGGRWHKASADYVDTHKVELAQTWMHEAPGAFVVWGTAMLVPMRVVRRIGMLDQRFFAYYEDLDLSIRSLDAGFHNMTDFTSTVNHDNKNLSFPPSQLKPHYCYYMARNERRFWRKHLGALKSLRASWRSARRLLEYRERFKAYPALRQAILAGIWHGWVGRSGPYDARFRAPRFVTWLADLYTRKRIVRPA